MIIIGREDTLIGSFRQKVEAASQGDWMEMECEQPEQNYGYQRCLLAAWEVRKEPKIPFL